MSVKIIKWSMWVLALGIVFGAHQQISREPAASREEVFLPKPELAKLAAIGFEAVASDYYWIQALYKVGATRDRPAEFAPYIAKICLLYTSPSPRDQRGSRMPSSA